jgi:serine/threonine-protein kinase
MMTATIAGVDARASLRAPAREIPPELDALCVRATALRPEDRHASVLALHDELEQFLDGDRDQELRRERSRAHATTAATAAQDAIARGDLGLRERALREVGRALALDADNTEAAETLVALLTTPPREVPAEARSALEGASHTRVRAAARIGSAVYASSLLFVPLVIAVGVLSWPALIAVSSGFIVTAALCFSLSFIRRPSRLALLGMSIVSTTALAACGLVWGPYVIVPSMLTVNTILYVEHQEIAPAWALILIGSLGLIVPTVLAWTGVVPLNYEFAEGAIKILPHAMRFRGGAAGPTELLLFSMNVATILFSGIYAVHFHRARAGAERQLQLQAWQLRKLVSRE